MTAGKIFQWLDVRECSLKSREITWPYTDRSSERATVRPHHRETNVLLSHFLASLGDREETNCTSMLWSTDSCQNRVSADQYLLTVSRTQVSTNQVIRWQFTRFQRIAGWDFFFKFIPNMLCLCHYRPALLRFWFQTDLRRKNSARFFKIQAGKTFSNHGHLLVTLHVQFLCSDWLKFDRWVHA